MFPTNVVTPFNTMDTPDTLKSTSHKKISLNIPYSYTKQSRRLKHLLWAFIEIL